jgi:glycogen synthase
MNILMLTTYYNPHISGLTLYFQRLAEEYVKLGHVVTVICAKHDKNLSSTERYQRCECN